MTSRGTTPLEHQHAYAHGSSTLPDAITSVSLLTGHNPGSAYKPLEAFRERLPGPFDPRFAAPVPPFRDSLEAQLLDVLVLFFAASYSVVGSMTKPFRHVNCSFWLTGLRGRHAVEVGL